MHYLEEKNFREIADERDRSLAKVNLCASLDGKRVASLFPVGWYRSVKGYLPHQIEPLFRRLIASITSLWYNLPIGIRYCPALICRALTAFT